MKTTTAIRHILAASACVITCALGQDRTPQAPTGSSVVNPPAQEAGGPNASIRELAKALKKMVEDQSQKTERDHQSRLAMERDAETPEARLDYHEARFDLIENYVNHSDLTGKMARDVVEDLSPVLQRIQIGVSERSRMIESIKERAADGRKDISRSVAPLVEKIRQDRDLLDTWRAGREAHDVEAQLAWEKSFGEVRDILTQQSASAARLKGYETDLEVLDNQSRNLRLAVGRFQNLADSLGRQAESGRQLARDAKANLQQDALVTMIDNLPRIDAGAMANLPTLPAVPALPAGSGRSLVPAPVADADVAAAILQAIEEKSNPTASKQQP